MPPWVRGLGYLTWYVGLAPVAMIHMLLTVLGGGQEPKLLEETPVLFMPWLLFSAVWVLLVIRMAGLWTP